MTLLFEAELESARGIDNQGPVVELLCVRRKRLIEWLQQQKSLSDPKEEKMFGSFLSFSAEFRARLNDVQKHLDRYLVKVHSSEKSTRPINVFLHAPPGGGKSSLIKALVGNLKNSENAKQLQNLAELEVVNLSNILQPEVDLVNIFDGVRKVSALKKIPVVFFDEIDIPAWNCYQHMLMPMWDGAYWNGRTEQNLESAIFFFAASVEDPVFKKVGIVRKWPYDGWLKEVQRETRDWCKTASAPAKARDFYSRIHLSVCIPPLNYHLCECAEKEKASEHKCLPEGQCYWQEEELLHLVRLTMKRGMFPTASSLKVDLRVLAYLAGGYPESKRDIEKLIFLTDHRKTQDGVLIDWDHLPLSILIKGPWLDECSELNQSYIELA